jgi:molybdopterin-synthase adenylyltransferase
MVLSADEIERYARHLILPEIGGPGQMRLKQSRVLVIGAGGLGAPLLLYLAAAGVGTIGIVDDDVVSLSNLQRQIIFSTHDIGEAKVDRATEALRRLNPTVKIMPHRLRLTAENVQSLVADYDVIADGSDNFETRYTVSDTCFALKKPLVTAALGRFDATLTTIKAHEKDRDGKPAPTFRCLFPAAPPAGTVPACAEAGVLGALAGVMGSLMALEIIRCLVPFGTGLVGRLLMVDAQDMRFETLTYEWDPKNPLNGQLS